MKTLTTNQTKVFCNTNQYWLSLREYEYPYKKNYPIKCFSRELKTYRGNNLHYYANKELRKIGLEKMHFIYKGKFPTIYRDDLNFLVSMTMEITGKWTANIYSASTDEGWFSSIPFTNREHNIMFEYNGKLTEESVLSACNKELNKYLYAHGWFRLLQEMNLKTKEQIKRRYRHELEEKSIESFSIPEVIFRWIERKMNLVIGENITDHEFIKAAKKIGRQNKRTIVDKYDYSWIHTFDGDVDEIEKEFFEREPEERTIFV